MTLSELLKPDLILPKVACSSKDDLIRKLVERVYSTGPALPFSQNDMLKTINVRELIGGTLLPSGLSVPHARLANFEDFILAFGFPEEPLLHEGLEIRMMALMITSQSGAPWYLTTLAVLTKISRDHEYLSCLCEAETPEDIIRIVRERDRELA
jgi:PTS system nitrogen regulatory IIA component